ncbi:hypothetical protein C8Q72DRAFT_742628, partial [Fomitopsis betulina]
FEQRIASTQMPQPGPAYFQARRALWWQPMVVSRQPAESSTPRRTLEDLLATENAYEDDGIWRAGVGKVYRALVDGARLKKRMPLRLVVRILLAGWVRDGTWPRGAVINDPDDEL